MQSKFIKKVTTAAIAATTLISLLQAPTVLANNIVSGPADTDVKISVRKTLDIAEGITTPNATFSFKFEPKQTDADGIAGAKTVPVNEVPAITDKTVAYSATDKLGSGKTNIQKETDNIFAGLKYPYAGEYVYTVSENKTGWTTNGVDNLTYDDHQYEMHVFVKNKKDGSGTYISTVYFKDITTPGASSGKKDAGTSSDTSKANSTFDLFENTYTKKAGKTTPGGDGGTPSVDTNAKSLTIKKVVAGDLGSKTKDFTFKLTFTKASTDQAGTYTAKKGNETITFNKDEEKSFTLHDGETLTFDDIPAGTRYTLKEEGASGYTPGAAYTENGEAKTGATGAQATEYKVENVLVGEQKNDNTVTNKFQDVTPTGLLIDNLPFILMIGLGLTGFVALSRKRRQG